MYICIKLQDGSKVERSIKKPSVTIGRSPTADFSVPYESLSRFHARIDLKDGKFFITDLGSSNGVFLDATRIEPNEKVPFATYMILAIGPLECVVEDELELNFPAQSETGKTKIDRTPPSNSRPRPERKTIKSTAGISPDAILIGLGLIVAITIYHLFTKNKEPIISINSVATTAAGANESLSLKPKPYRAKVPNQNTLASVYMNHFAAKTCTEMFEICKELQIEDNKSEGLVRDGSELFIFVKPSKLYVHSRLAKLKNQPEAEDVLAHYLILGSTVIQSLLKHERDQIHVVIISTADQPVKAFRYHVSQFDHGGIDLSGLVDALSGAIRTNQLKDVSETLQKFFPPFDLTNS